MDLDSGSSGALALRSSGPPQVPMQHHLRQPCCSPLLGLGDSKVVGKVLSPQPSILENMGSSLVLH